MKAYDLQPTSENIEDMLMKDAIDRNKDILFFLKLLYSIDGPFSIALNGQWGSGKTFFVKQVKMILDAFNSYIPSSENDEIVKGFVLSISHSDIDFSSSSQVAVYYDAWANDNNEDPILSIIYEVIHSVNFDIAIGKNRDLYKIMSSIGDFFTGKRVSAFLEEIKGMDPLKPAKKEKAINELMSGFFEKLIVEHGNRLVIFIDELDRCKPSYAVQLLERVKHYMIDDRITFVFSVNVEQLQYTIKQYYGESFNATKYLDRFFDLRMSLPPANIDKYFRYISFTNSMYIYDKICHMVISIFNFELREIAKFINLTKIAAFKPTHSNVFRVGFSEESAMQYALTYIVPITIGLQIHDISTYMNFISGNDNTPLIEIYDKSTGDLFRVKDLLNSNESYSKNDKDSTIVSKKDKIKAVYDALFVQDYSGDKGELWIGKLRFNANTKNELLRTVSLMSDFADYSK